MRNKTTPYVEPIGTILDVSETDGVCEVILEFDRMDTGPVAPAGLYVDAKSSNERFQLHRVVSNEGMVFKFQTFNRSHPLPEIGEKLKYRGWWLQEAMDAALDSSHSWVKKEYPDNGDHDHCLFTWENIASYTDCNVGYYSEKYGWITCDAYENFIEGDIYNLRTQSA